MTIFVTWKSPEIKARLCEQGYETERRWHRGQLSLQSRPTLFFSRTWALKFPLLLCFSLIWLWWIALCLHWYLEDVPVGGSHSLAEPWDSYEIPHLIHRESRAVVRTGGPFKACVPDRYAHALPSLTKISHLQWFQIYYLCVGNASVTREYAWQLSFSCPFASAWDTD